MNFDLLAAVIAAIGFGWCYYRIFKGTGLIVGVLLELVVGIAVLNLPLAGIWIALALGIGAFLVEVRHQRQRKKFISAEMTFEGGGIRRGLTPVLAAVLFERSKEEILQLGLVESLNTGTIVMAEGDQIGFRLAEHLRVGGEVINPAEKLEARKQAGREANQVISGTDDILLELVRQNEGKPLAELGAGIWLERVGEEAEFAVTGFDIEQTKSYYDAWISHRLMGVAGDHFEAEEYLGWLLLAEMTGILEEGAIKVVKEKISFDWLGDGDLGAWLEKVF